MRLIDSHCHLNYEGLADRQDEVLSAARERGVAGFLNISTRQCEWNDVIAAAESNDDVWASVGVHPHEADAHPDLGAAALVEAANHPRVIASGECGLDYYYDKSGRAAQRQRFEAHIEAARQTGLPLVVHTRDAEDDTRAIIADARSAGAIGVLHCYTGSHALAELAIDSGWYVSFAGMVTFKKWADDDLLRLVPRDRLLVESDSPYLAPMPFRGKRNEPAWVSRTLAKVASARDDDALELGKATVANARRLFALAFDAAQ